MVEIRSRRDGGSGRDGASPPPPEKLGGGILFYFLQGSPNIGIPGNTVFSRVGQRCARAGVAMSRLNLR